MAYKSILSVWDGRDASRPALDLAIETVRAENGHLTVLCLGIDHVQPGLYYGGVAPTVITDNIERARAEARANHARAEEILGASGINWSAQAVVAQLSGLSHVVGGAARYSDLVVLPRPYGEGVDEAAPMILEAALFDGEAPVLVCPPRPVAEPPGRRIVIAWNESPEAMAAVRAALPLIRRAEVVDIAIVDPRPRAADEADPGFELSQMLARHGAEVTVSILARTVPRIAEVLQRHATDTGADLIVMGAYGHSRFREAILGGATRDMLEDVDIPVLMAR